MGRAGLALCIALRECRDIAEPTVLKQENGGKTKITWIWEKSNITNDKTQAFSADRYYILFYISSLPVSLFISYSYHI